MYSSLKGIYIVFNQNTHNKRGKLVDYLKICKVEHIQLILLKFISIIMIEFNLPIHDTTSLFSLKQFV